MGAGAVAATGAAILAGGVFGVPARVAVLGVAAMPAAVFAALGARRGASYRMISGPVGLAGRFALGDGACGRGVRGVEGAGEAFDIRGLESCVDGVSAAVGSR